MAGLITLTNVACTSHSLCYIFSVSSLSIINVYVVRRKLFYATVNYWFVLTLPSFFSSVIAYLFTMGDAFFAGNLFLLLTYYYF
jgi:hypothetical protein